MDYNYFLTFAAEKDIDETFEYISNELLNIDAAKNLADNLEMKFEDLTKTPKMGRIVDNPFLRREDVRLVHVDNYLVYYIVDEKSKSVVILRVVFSGRNQDKILKEM